MNQPETVRFADLGLDPALVQAAERLGFDEATPIQAAAIPVMLERRDVIGRARTGSGKTAAFGLPLLQTVREGGTPPRALIMTPTRELALQVTEALRSFAQGLPVRVATVYGGTPYPPQIAALKKATIVVGTPGRLLDHLGRGTLSLSGIELFVLDEADEMLRMGFIDDVSELLSATPEGRQVALFSATMPPEIRRIAEAHLTDPSEVQVEGQAMAVDHIEQRWIRVPNRHKIDALVRVLGGVEHDAVLVFARTRAGCAEVADELTRRGVAVDALHGDLSQGARERVLGRLRARRLDVVIATDVAARGIDVDHITHVVNFDLPTDTETYVHRIGRTGRVGREGTAITFATPKEKQRMRRMARQLRVPIDQIEVPSDADIARQRQRALTERLIEAMGSGGAEVRQWLEAFLAEQEADATDVAVAAVRLLAEAQGTPLGTIPEESAPGWARPVRRGDAPRDARGSDPEGPSRPAPPDEDDNEVQLFFPVGRRRNVRPSDVVGALTNEAGIDGRRIGRVQILDRKTFVGVSREVATLILDRLSHVQIRGNDVPIALARPGTGRRPAPSRRPGPLRRGQGPGGGKPPRRNWR
ncbi:MAG TPA: DEAD/DEAH box helicase [Deltaproteobacteria bacterium]|nr:DEAD/DEAH box helicase [Deltaproteobacteria bacterium]